MNEHMDTETHQPEKVIVSGEQWRAWLAIGFPLFILAFVMCILSGKGLHLWDIPKIIAIGELNLWAQLVGWSAFPYWLKRYWPPALEMLRAGGRLVYAKAGVLFLAGGTSIPAHEVADIVMENRFLSKRLVFVANDGQRHCIGGFWHRQGVEEIKASAREIVESAKQVSNEARLPATSS